MYKVEFYSFVSLFILLQLFKQFLFISTDGTYTLISNYANTVVVTPLSNSSILLSTTQYMGIYTKSLVELSKYTIPSYSKNGNIIQLKSGNFILASDNTFSILNKDNPENVECTETYNTGNDSPFISLFPLSESSFIIANSISNTAAVSIYNGNNKVNTTTIPNIYANAITCIYLIDYVVCSYVNQANTKETHVYVLSSELQSPKLYKVYDITEQSNKNSRIEPASETLTNGVRISKLSDSTFVICILKDNNNFYCNTAIIEDRETIYKQYPTSSVSDVNFPSIYKCYLCIEYTSIAVLDQNTFATTCRDLTQVNSFLFAKISVAGGNMNYVYKLKCQGDDSTSTEFAYTRSLFASSKALAIYYLVDSSLRERLIYYPGCITYEVTPTEVLGNSEGELDFTNYVLLSAAPLDITLPTIAKINISPKDIYNDTISSVIIKDSNGNEISEERLYDFTGLTYIAGNTGGTITYTFAAIYDSLNDAAKYCKLIFKVLACATECYNCTAQGTSDDTKCILCDIDNNYYPLYNKSSQCHHKDSPPDGYFFNEENKVFKPCYDSCKSCYGIGTRDASNCRECNTDYYPLEDDSKRCYKSDEDVNFYYYNSTNTQFEQCHEGCLLCSGEGEDTNFRCTSCDQTNTNDSLKFYPSFQGLSATFGICYNEETKPHNYYKNPSDVYDECEVGCYSCTTKDTTNSVTDCDECDIANKYYPLSDDLSSPYDCHLETSPPNYYFYNGSQMFYKCDLGCLTCDAAGANAPTMNNTNCNECDRTNGFAEVEGINGLCYDISLSFDRYVYNASSSSFKPCTTGCLKCSLLSDITQTECSECDTVNGYFPLIRDSGDLECINSERDGYYYNSTTNSYEKCYLGCASCNGYGDDEHPNCKSNSCNINFYPMLLDPTNCWNYTTGNTRGYYLSNNNNFIKCIENCLTCSQEEATFQTNCDSCNTPLNYYPLSNDSSQCVDESSKPTNSFFDSDNSVYQICYESCGSCEEVGTTIDDPKCLTCYEDNGYYTLEKETGNICINEAIKDSSYPNYFYSGSTNRYEKCSLECESCEGSASQCKVCNNAENYFELDISSTGVLKFCKGEEIKASGYYLDTSITPYKFKKCYTSCGLCDEGGDETDHKCTRCATNYVEHPKIAGQCVRKCTYYYYIDTNNEYHCTPSKSCPSSYKYLSEDIGECSSSCESSRYTFGETCVIECPSDTVVNGRECKALDICKKTQYEVSSSITTMSSNIDVFGKNYCTEFRYTNKHVNIITNEDALYTVVIYKDENCAKEFVVDLTTLELAGCPEKLRDYYGIADDVSLTTLQMAIERPGQTDQISYAFFNSETGERLDLSLCEGEKINVTVKISTTEGVNITQAEEFAAMGIDVYNSSDPFFNDVCIPYTSESGKDVTLEERRKNYYQNVSFCEEGCNFTGVNLREEAASCECEVKTSFMSDLLDNPLTGEFLDMLNDANFEVLGCFTQVFTFGNIIKNIGGWIIFGLGLCEIAVTFVYVNKGLIQMRIYLLQYMKVNPPKNSNESVNSDKSDNNNTHSNVVRNIAKFILKEDSIENNEAQLESSHHSNQIDDADNHNNISNDIDSRGEPHSSSRYAEEYEEDEKENIPKRNKSLISGRESNLSRYIDASPANFLKKDEKPKKIVMMVLNKQYADDNDEKKEEEDHQSNKRKINKQLSAESTMLYTGNNFNPKPSQLISTRTNNELFQIIEKNEEFNQKKKGITIYSRAGTGESKVVPTEESEEDEYSDSELNDLDLYDAIIFDKRSFCTFYWRQLKEKQNIINTFFVYDVLEPYTIKIICFFFGIAMYFTLNALFYTESSISEDFYAKDTLSIWYTFKNQLSRCLYASMVGIAASFVLSCLSSSKVRIKSLIKRVKDPVRFRQEAFEIIKDLKKKTIIFLVVNYALMIFFWYYVSAFCFCYQNTQVSWVIGGVITWGITEVFPFLLCLFISIFRYIGIKYKMESAYKISVCLSD